MIVVQTDNGGVVVEPPGRPAVITDPRQSFTVEWFGTDGSHWNLTRGGDVILAPGVRGFGMPNPEHWLRDSLGDGASYHGTRFPAREVVMPVALIPRMRSGFLPLDRAFMGAMNPRGEGVLRVTDPFGQYREITCRYTGGADEAFPSDPLFHGSTTYPLTLIAADPYWRGAPITRTFRTQVDVAKRPTFPPVGDPLSFYFRRADTLDGEGQITNPGDIGANLVMVVKAPFIGFSVGLKRDDDDVVTVDMELTKSTGAVVVDTSGGMTRMYDETGANVRAYATDFLSAPIPPGESTLKLEVYGPGAGSSVEVSFEPRYYRAW